MKKIILLAAIALSACGAFAQTFPNAGFEAWRVDVSGTSNPQIVMAPRSWYGADSLIIFYGQFFGSIIGIPDTVWSAQLFQDSINKHSGNYSAKLVTEDQDTLGIFPGILSNAKANVPVSLSGVGAITYSGGTMMVQKPTTVSAWIKYLPANARDSAFVSVQVLARIGSRDSVVGVADLRFGGTDTAFRMVTASITYQPIIFTVDTIRVTFGSSFGANRTEKSTLYVDDVSMTTIPQGLAGSIAVNNSINVFPNPAVNTFRFVATQRQPYTGQLFGNAGNLIKEFTFTDATELDVTALPEGIYIYTIANNSGEVSKGTLSIVR